MNPEVEQDVGAMALALRRINHVLDSHSRRQNVLSGLTAAQTLTLAALAASTEPPSVTQLSEAVSLSQATTSDITKRLANRGLIQRVRDPGDGRRTVIHLTDAGVTALSSAASLLPDDFVQRFEALRPARRRRLLSSLLDLAALLADTPIQNPKDPCVESTEKSVSITNAPTGTPIKESTTR